MIGEIDGFVSLSERLLGMYSDRKQLVSDTDAFIRALQMELHYNRSLLSAIDTGALDNTPKSLGIASEILSGLRTTMLETLLIQQNSRSARKAIKRLKATEPISEKAFDEVAEHDKHSLEKKNIITAAEFLVVKIETLQALNFLVGEKNETIRRNTRVKTRLENIEQHLKHISALITSALGKS